MSKRLPVRKVSDQALEKDNNEYSLMVINTMSATKPLIVPVTVDNCSIDMEVDTGAAVSLIAETTYKQHWTDKPLQSSMTRLKTYSGEEIEVIGTIQVNVQYNNQQASLPLLVVGVVDRVCLGESG